MAKVMSVQEAAQLIKDGDTVWIVSSGGGVAEPGYVLAGIEERFLKTGRPRDLTVCHASGIGDRQGVAQIILRTRALSNVSLAATGPGLLGFRRWWLIT